ncbi:MAG: cysteine hydrolase family protein [Lentilitoribacter sp.]
MPSFNDNCPTLLVIDVQKGFLDETLWGGKRNNKDAEEVCGKLIALWRDHKFPVIHIKHASTDPKSALHPSQSGHEFNEYAVPIDGELVFEKNVNSAFIGTDLKDVLDAKNTSAIVVIGLTTDHCVSTTTRMAGNYGYEVFLISDATATFDKMSADNKTLYPADLIHETALASLNGEFATVLNSDELMAMLSDSSD